jgi:hypothetical protein
MSVTECDRASGKTGVVRDLGTISRDVKGFSGCIEFMIPPGRSTSMNYDPYRVDRCEVKDDIILQCKSESLGRVFDVAMIDDKNVRGGLISDLPSQTFSVVPDMDGESQLWTDVKQIDAKLFSGTLMYLNIAGGRDYVISFQYGRATMVQISYTLTTD